MHPKKLLLKTVYCVIIVLIAAGFLPFSSGFAKDENALSHVIALPENENVVLVEKKTQRFMIYSVENEKWVKKLDVSCSTGEVGGVKVEAGDKKTPEGVYFIKDEYEDRYLTPIYGKRAFPIDYPNFLDRVEGKNGSAIWIHGTNKVLKPMDSNGCIALENENVVKLSDLITLDSTPVIIVENFSGPAGGSGKLEIRDAVINFLEGWKSALVEGTYHDFLRFYSASYLPDMGYWHRWKGVVRKAKKNGTRFGIVNDNIGIYVHDGIFTVLLDQILTAGDKKYPAGKRKLYIVNEENGLRIIGDVKQVVPKTADIDQEPIVRLAENVLNPQAESNRVLTSVKNWLKAWSDKDMETYASFYASNFFSDGMNKKKWVDRKKTISKKYSYIHIKGSDYKVLKLKDGFCEVSFFQIYESSGFNAKGIKSLKLVKEGGSWKISQESWKRK